MTYYCHTDDLDRPGFLPKSWRNVSGLDKLDDTELAKLGWYPFEPTDQPSVDDLHDYLQSEIRVENSRAKQFWTNHRREQIPSVESMVQDQVRVVKEACGEAILAEYPTHKQINFTARATELLKNRNERDLTDEELREQKDLEGVWSWVNRQRDRSNVLEDAINAIATGAGSDDEKRLNVQAIRFEAVP